MTPRAAGHPHPPPSPLGRGDWAPASAALLALLVSTVVSALAARLTHPGGVGAARFAWPGAFWLQGRVQYDGGWYAHIAQHGYQYTPGVQSPVAFFPGYPLLVRAVMALGPDVFLSGVLVSAACGLAAVLLFTRWA